MRSSFKFQRSVMDLEGGGRRREGGRGTRALFGCFDLLSLT
jgi:hypothetical protein